MKKIKITATDRKGQNMSINFILPNEKAEKIMQYVSDGVINAVLDGEYTHREYGAMTLSISQWRRWVDFENTCNNVLYRYTITAQDITAKPKMSTMSELADYINNSDEWPTDVADIIEANGWESDDDDYEVCHNENDRLILRERNGKLVAEVI